MHGKSVSWWTLLCSIVPGGAVWGIGTCLYRVLVPKSNDSNIYANQELRLETFPNSSWDKFDKLMFNKKDMSSPVPYAKGVEIIPTY